MQPGAARDAFRFGIATRRDGRTLGIARLQRGNLPGRARRKAYPATTGIRMGAGLNARRNFAAIATCHKTKTLVPCSAAGILAGAGIRQTRADILAGAGILAVALSKGTIGSFLLPCLHLLGGS